MRPPWLLVMLTPFVGLCWYHLIPPDRVTLEHYVRIEPGKTTLQEVEGILGADPVMGEFGPGYSDGRPVSEFQWYRDGRTITVGFQKGMIVQKSEQGLE
jgi:hypothetical protein